MIMIKVDLRGRMGNQMFQYSFAYSASKKLKTFFVMNQAEHRFQLPQYFKLDFLTRLLFNQYVFDYYQKVNHKFPLKKEIEVAHDESNVILTNNTRYIGFFQSDFFFKADIKQLRKRFSIKKKWVSLFEQKYGDLFRNNKIVVVHVRRTDYLYHGDESLGSGDLSLPMAFYEKCLGKIEELNNYKVLCISDDILFVKDYFKDRLNFLFESNNAIVDFQLLMNANVLIIANSSFAWWAAYLNQVPGKLIFAPKYWIGFKTKEEHPRGIMTPLFNWVDVD
jgi:hypothetical protein